MIWSNWNILLDPLTACNWHETIALPFNPTKNVNILQLKIFLWLKTNILIPRKCPHLPPEQACIITIPPRLQELPRAPKPIEFPCPSPPPVKRNCLTSTPRPCCPRILPAYPQPKTSCLPKPTLQHHCQHSGQN